MLRKVRKKKRKSFILLKCYLWILIICLYIGLVFTLNFHSFKQQIFALDFIGFIGVINYFSTHTCLSFPDTRDIQVLFITAFNKPSNQSTYNQHQREAIGCFFNLIYFNEWTKFPDRSTDPCPEHNRERLRHARGPVYLHLVRYISTKNNNQELSMKLVLCHSFLFCLKLLLPG